MAQNVSFSARDCISVANHKSKILNTSDLIYILEVLDRFKWFLDGTDKTMFLENFPPGNPIHDCIIYNFNTCQDYNFMIHYLMAEMIESISHIFTDVILLDFIDRLPKRHINISDMLDQEFLDYNIPVPSKSMLKPFKLTSLFEIGTQELKTYLISNHVIKKISDELVNNIITGINYIQYKLLLLGYNYFNQFNTYINASSDYNNISQKFYFRIFSFLISEMRSIKTNKINLETIYKLFTQNEYCNFNFLLTNDVPIYFIYCDDDLNFTSQEIHNQLHFDIYVDCYQLKQDLYTSINYIVELPPFEHLETEFSFGNIQPHYCDIHFHPIIYENEFVTNHSKRYFLIKSDGQQFISIDKFINH